MKNSHIQWTDHTFNPWIGCTKISDGCTHCYAEVAFTTKMKGIKWGKGAPRHRTTSVWKEPLQWNKTPSLCPIHGAHLRFSSDGTCGVSIDFNHRDGHTFCQEITHKPRVFCASLSDWLDDEVPIEWLADLLKLIHDTPNLDWQLLTKRPENWNKRAYAAIDKLDSDTAWWLQSWAENKPPQNVWIGTTVENQPMADKRIPELLKIPTKIRFLSVEPMLEEIRLHKRPDGGTGMCRICGLVNKYPKVGWPVCACGNSGRDSHRGFSSVEAVDWVIVGGESGPKARPCNIDWIRSIKDQCQAANVPVFVKQLGAKPECNGDHGMRLPLTHPKGGDPSEWPTDLRIQQFPEPSTLNSQPSPN